MTSEISSAPEINSGLLAPPSTASAVRLPSPGVSKSVTTHAPAASRQYACPRASGGTSTWSAGAPFLPSSTTVSPAADSLNGACSSPVTGVRAEPSHRITSLSPGSSRFEGSASSFVGRDWEYTA